MKLRIPPAKDIWTAACFLLLAVILVFSCVWVWNQYLKTPPYVDPARYPVRGIDISSHNGEIDFKAVRKDGIEFAFIKASEGTDFKDKNFLTNYKNARKAGIKTGAYHFFRFDKDGVDQAINFLRATGNRRLDLGIAIDIEQQGNPENVDSTLIADRLTSMVEYLNLLGYRVTLYTNRSGYEKFLMDTFPGHPLWICSFSDHPIDAEWTFWQYDHHGKINGIKGDVDLDTFNGSRKDWEEHLKK